MNWLLFPVNDKKVDSDEEGNEPSPIKLREYRNYF